MGEYHTTTRLLIYIPETPQLWPDIPTNCLTVQKGIRRLIKKKLLGERLLVTLVDCNFL